MYELYLILKALVICVGIPIVVLWLLVVREKKQNSQSPRQTKLPYKKTYKPMTKAGSIDLIQYDILTDKERKTKHDTRC